MTKYQRIDATCPNCHTNQQAEVYQTLNVTMNPEKKYDLFEGRINVLTCINCQEKVSIETTFLYHDMALKLAIYYYPPSLINTDDFLQQFHPDGTMNYPEGVFPDAMQEGSSYLIKHPHIVFHMSELIAYVMFRDKLSETQTNQNN